MSSRRAFLKLLGSVPIAGNAATKAIAAELASPALMAAMAGAESLNAAAGMGTMGQQVVSYPERVFGKAVGRYISSLANRAIEERNFANILRTDGLDHDISALRSCSRAYKVGKQLERDRATIEFFQAMQAKVWG